MTSSPPGSEYRPKSRRPIADAFRATAGGAVSLCVRLGVHPDVISYLSIVASAIAAVCFWQSARMPLVLLIAGSALCYLRLWFNMLDGMVAMASGKASPRGEILNDLPDRLSDVLVFVGVAHSGWCFVDSGYWAAIFALLTAYVGTLGQAIGVQREFSGIMSKPWRMVTLHIGSWVLLASLLLGHGAMRIMDVTLMIIIVGCIQTIWIRLARIMRSLRIKSQTGA